MTHTRIETVTFTKTTYTCDFDGVKLLEGQKPIICPICKQEFCVHHTRGLLLPGDPRPEDVCVRCSYMYNSQYRQLFVAEYKKFLTRNASLLKQWKEAALKQGTPEKGEG